MSDPAVADRGTGRRTTTARVVGAARWVALAVAAATLVIFLVAQRQTVDVSFAEGPTSAMPEGSAGELGDATVPSVEELTAMVDNDPVVRLPGSIADWDEAVVRGAIADSGLRILVAPPGLDEDERARVKDVENADLRVIGTEVSGGVHRVEADTLAQWRDQFAAADVTSQLVTMIGRLRELPDGAADTVDHAGLTWRDPTGTELAAVAADLRATGIHSAAEATLDEVPEKSVHAAFPDDDLLVVALPRQSPGEPAPRYGPALADLFPDTPIIVMYGWWVEYHGPHRGDIENIVATSFYAQFGPRLSSYDYPQHNVLHAYLNRVAEVRFSGLFDRALPYVPFDPLRVALPALPWVFGGCVAVFLALSLRPLLDARSRTGTPARLAGLSALSIEVSGLSGRESDPALTRGIATLQAARDAVENDLPETHVRSLLDDAERELASVAKALGRTDYQPDVYLRSRIE